MKKIMNIAAIAALIVGMAACQKDDTSSANNSSQGEKTLKNAVTRPFSGHSTGTIAIVYSEENECYPNFSQVQFFGSGTGTHIGNSTSEGYVCSNQQGGLEGTFYYNFTAANGDKVYCSQPDPSVFTIDQNGNVTGEFNITGGTGRFEGATGHINTYGVDDFVNLTFDIYSEGTITY
jgi:Cu/Zn superoxide dismutase